MSMCRRGEKFHLNHNRTSTFTDNRPESIPGTLLTSYPDTHTLQLDFSLMLAHSTMSSLVICKNLMDHLRDFKVYPLKMRILDKIKPDTRVFVLFLYYPEDK